MTTNRPSAASSWVSSGARGISFRRRKEERRFSISFNYVFSIATAVPEPIAMHEKIWSEEPHFLRGPSLVKGHGVFTSLGSDVLRELVGNIHFVCTETSVIWKGYMDGAVRSGQRGAEEVIVGLQGYKPRQLTCG
ncbi:hypothetical protein F5Y06DRAFT_175152 [Hypoxylon sp. FL0890]|nr:hypothetical protein F5Y06DRAFT_175152 [Hypoxylon sp. FL0890]